MWTRTRSALSSLGLLGICLVAPVLHGQVAPTLTPGARVRVWAPPTAEGHEGTFEAIDTVTVRALLWRRAALVGRERSLAQISDTIPLSSVQRLEVFERRRSHGRVILRSLGGAVVGTALGWWIIDGSRNENRCDGGSLCFANAGSGAMIGGVVGLALGAYAGARPVSRWVAVPILRR